MGNVLIQQNNNPTISNLNNWYKCDEGSGTTLEDSSGNSYDLTHAGDQWSSNGPNGIQGSFDPSGTAAQITDSAGDMELLGGDFSMACWIQKSAAVPTGPLVSRTKNVGGSDYAGYYFNIDTTYWQLYIGRSTPGFETFQNTHGLGTSGGWYHVAFTFDLSEKECRFYRNGTYVNSDDSTASFRSEVSTVFFVGDSATILGFSGNMCDVRLYKTLLTASEVLQIYRYLG